MDTKGTDCLSSKGAGGHCCALGRDGSRGLYVVHGRQLTLGDCIFLVGCLLLLFFN